MRTVDPELWYRKLKKPPLLLTRRMNFGQKRSNNIETCLRKSFIDAIIELWDNCSIAGIKYMQNMNIGRLGRYMYICTTLLILAGGLVLVLSDIADILTGPLIVVSLQSAHDSIDEMHFPAIALCSNNVISKRSIANYTKFLVKKSNKVYNESYIESQLMALGALVTIRPLPFDPTFFHFLTSIEEEFNVTDFLFRFSTACSSMLLRCSWRGSVVPCASLFAVRITPLGFCCVFNSRYQPEDVNTPPRILDMVGQDFGLGVVIKEDHEDFVYMRRSIYGMEMLMFDGSQYPLLEDGSVRMYPLPRNTSLYLSVLVREQQVYTDALRYSESMVCHYPDNFQRHCMCFQRGCRVRSPQWKGFSWCLANCRCNAMVALCGCVPVTLVPPSMTSTHPTCTLSNLACLYKYKEKLIYLNPWDSSLPELSEESQDGLDCPECMFDCERITYSAQLSYSDYVSKQEIFKNYLSGGISLRNGSVIRVFYNTENQHKYAVETYSRSVELIARSGSMWILATGVSGVSVVELVFHCTLRWVRHFIRRYNLAKLRIH